MQSYDGVPSRLGHRQVWLVHLTRAADWPALLDDEDWDRIVERDRWPFGLFTVSDDPRPELDGWSALADHLVSRECVLTCSWGPGSSLLDDVVDESAVTRSVVLGLPTAEPVTTWHDGEPLGSALKLFLDHPGTDLREPDGRLVAWERIVLVVGSNSRLDDVRIALDQWGRA